MSTNIYVTLKCPMTNIYVDILGEKHYKTSSQEEKCNNYINDDNIKYIFVEDSYRNFLTAEYNCFEFMIEVLSRLFFNKRCSIDAAIKNNINKKQIYSLGGKESVGLSDDFTFNVASLCWFLGCVFCHLNEKISIYLSLFCIVILAINVIMIKMLNFFNYKFRSRFSETFYFRTELYRREKIMAEQFIQIIKDQCSKFENSKIIVIFGVNHYEGIIYYLNQKGFTLVNEEIKF